MTNPLSYLLVAVLMTASGKLASWFMFIDRRLARRR